MQNFAPSAPDVEKKSAVDANPMIRQYNITFQVGDAFAVQHKALEIPLKARHCNWSAFVLPAASQ